MPPMSQLLKRCEFPNDCQVHVHIGTLFCGFLSLVFIVLTYISNFGPPILNASGSIDLIGLSVNILQIKQH